MVSSIYGLIGFRKQINVIICFAYRYVCIYSYCRFDKLAGLLADQYPTHKWVGDVSSGTKDGLPHKILASEDVSFNQMRELVFLACSETPLYLAGQ